MFSVLCLSLLCQGKLPYPVSSEIVVPKDFHLLQCVCTCQGYAERWSFFPSASFLSHWWDNGCSPPASQQPRAAHGPATATKDPSVLWWAPEMEEPPSWRLQKQGQSLNSIGISSWEFILGPAPLSILPTALEGYGAAWSGCHTRSGPGVLVGMVLCSSESQGELRQQKQINWCSFLSSK